MKRGGGDEEKAAMREAATKRRPRRAGQREVMGEEAVRRAWGRKSVDV